jgi:hypothetical protein
MMPQPLLAVPSSKVRDCFAILSGEHKSFLGIEEQEVAGFLEDEIDLMRDILRIVTPVVVEPLRTSVLGT